MADSTTGTGGWTTRRYLSLLGTVAIWLIVAVDAWFLWPSTLGGNTSIVIVSGQSMEPTYFSGDLVIARAVEPSVGDVIVYAPDGFGGSQIVHRIIGGNADEGWQMQGDNNDFIDPFTPSGDEVKGVVMVHYPSFGRITSLILNPIVWAFVLLASLVLLLWYSDDCDDDDEEEDTDDAARAAGSDGDSPEAGEADPAPASDAPQGAGVTARAATAFAALAVALGVGVSPAAASQLTVDAGVAAYATQFEKCADMTITASPDTQSAGNNWTGIDLAGLSADCVGRDLSVTLIHNNGSVTLTATGTVTGTSQTVATAGTYGVNQVADVVVKVGGWPFLAIWDSGPDPQVPPVGTCAGYWNDTGELVTGTTCALSVGSLSGLNYLNEYNGGPGYYRDVQMTTAFTPSALWENGVYVGEYHALTRFRYTLDLTASPFADGMDFSNGFALYGNGNNARLAPGETCDDLSAITIEEDQLGSNPTTNFTLSEVPIAWKPAASLWCTS